MSTYDVTFHSIRFFTRSEDGKLKLLSVTNNELKELGLEALDVAGYRVSLEEKQKDYRCPLCHHKAHMNMEEKHGYWGKTSDVFFVACSNKAECGLRTPDFWTKLDAENGWERLCSHGKE
jgi:hypothetical protein